VFDFRGRLYIDSVISYQSAKIFRHLYGYSTLIDSNAAKSIIDNIDNYIEQILTQTNLIKDYPQLDVIKYQKEVF